MLLRTIDVSDNNIGARGYGCLVAAAEACPSLSQVIANSAEMSPDAARSLGPCHMTRIMRCDCLCVHAHAYLRRRTHVHVKYMPIHAVSMCSRWALARPRVLPRFIACCMLLCCAIEAVLGRHREVQRKADLESARKFLSSESDAKLSDLTVCAVDCTSSQLCYVTVAMFSSLEACIHVPYTGLLALASPSSFQR